MVWKLFCLILAVIGPIRASAGPEAAPDATASQVETVTLKIDGWTCASCEKDIRRKRWRSVMPVAARSWRLSGARDQ